MMPRRRKEEKSRNLRDSVEVTIFYPSKTVECLTIFGSRLNLVLSIVISNTCIFYAVNDRRCLGIVDSSRRTMITTAAPARKRRQCARHGLPDLSPYPDKKRFAYRLST